MSSSGWSASDTARYGVSSTSYRTAWTSASLPARNMSWASARRAPGRSTTRLPRLTSRPPMMTVSVSGDTEASASGFHHGAAASPAGPAATSPAYTDPASTDPASTGPASTGPASTGP